MANRDETPTLPLIRVLEGLERFLEILDDTEYRSIPSTLFSSTHGQQVRHTLDHVDRLVEGYKTGVMNYDNRQRGTSLETNRAEGLESVRRLKKELGSMEAEAMNREVRVHILMDPSGPMLDLGSTLGREIGFVLSHTIHHNALLAAMGKNKGMQMEEDFGFAPSTLAFTGSV